MRRILIFGTLLLLLVTAGWWLLLMSPKSGEISDFNEQRDAAQLEESTLQSRKNELEALAAREGDFLLGISEVQSSIPLNPDGAALIEDINRLAEDSDIDLVSFSPEVPVAGTIEGLVEIPMTLTFEAPYFKALSFLFALEDLERLIRIEQVSITATVLEDGTNLLSTTLTATAFSFSDLAGGTPEATP
ncbi:MAG: type 4a pilus biogenesis protein PilO [Acidimicrobiia bacterium]|nr:type 4a pilus biogenesis protein PilO [Acidimicrobiia bacterium]